MFSALKKSLRIEPKVEAPKVDLSNKDEKETDAGEVRIEDIIVVKDLDATRVEGDKLKVEDVREEDVFVVKDLDAEMKEEDVKEEQNTSLEVEVEVEVAVEEDSKKEAEEMRVEDILVIKDLDAKVETDDMKEEDVSIAVEAEDMQEQVEEASSSASASTPTTPTTPTTPPPPPTTPPPTTTTFNSRSPEEIEIPSPPISEIGDDDVVEERDGKQTLLTSAIILTPGNDRCLVGSPPATAANPISEVNKNEETSTSTSPRHSGAISPSPIENHSNTKRNQEKRFSSSTTDFEINAPNTPPATPPRVVRRERSASQREREILRSRQFSETARLQRSAEKPEKSEADLGLGRRRKRYQHRHKSKGSISGSGEALKAVEPLHEHQLGKMAFAEQQQWITVQQKTFTKW